MMLRPSLPLLGTAIISLAMSPVFAQSAKQESRAADTLHATVAALDEALFDAFNHCSDPAQLQRHADYFDEDIEFYHDLGGVTLTRGEMIANTAKNACGKYRRELVAGTLEAFPIKGYGALARGTHRFCKHDTDTCEGRADFVLLWREQAGRWQVTRAFSFAHGPDD
ncbi:nuclear transport factor 2 family protein [Luteimonas vadosa]|uniref:DUF4440 domain-containing protein n=1 Tax=Luteimonas vadosa TaxID=1165507 RepID=A0ABP9DWF0_9GAMM